MDQIWTLRGSESGLMALKQGEFRVAYQLTLGLFLAFACFFWLFFNFGILSKFTKNE